MFSISGGNMQTEITSTTPLLNQDGELIQVGWARYPLLECNLENVAFYPRFLRPLQFARVKAWDYYAIFTPQRFFSATIANLGYAGNIFVYMLDFESGDLHEEGLIIPLGQGVTLSRQTVGVCEYQGQGAHLRFETHPEARQIFIDWPGFHEGRGIHTEISLQLSQGHESMNIVIPIPQKRFYYNHKINCLPASGRLRYGEFEGVLQPEDSLGQLDWGRGVWEYSSFWNWASASGFLPDGRTIGLNLGCGFGDTSAATENALIFDGKIHKLDQVTFEYDATDFMKPWKFRDNKGRLALDFAPFKDRFAATKLLVIDSEVHQLFGRYSGKLVADDGEEILLDGLIGFAEEHRARW
jgi:hypothetical protein